ncbi:hypothetical protein RDI58_015443 [Solanum bulbocastanum]|uniref:Reverse transcriptase zinc-binding domain-containing protein n=1 Tax=Solanum bulbocastanum TaxID=147425 RepID=A0AAN8TEC2_SOLBU
MSQLWSKLKALKRGLKDLNTYLASYSQKLQTARQSSEIVQSQMVTQPLNSVLIEQESVLLNDIRKWSLVEEQVPLDCAFCATPTETFDHLYFECPVTRALWSRLLLWIGFGRTIGSWQQELEWTNAWARKKTGKCAIVSCVFAMVYTLYGGKERACNSKQDPTTATESAKRLLSIFKFPEETFQNGGLLLDRLP